LTTTPDWGSEKLAIILVGNENNLREWEGTGAEMLTRPAGHEAKAEARKSEATMYEAEAEARHVREQLSVYEHAD